ncbi:MAG: ester cyclase [Pirellulales bacterium]|nr:ester cyclase [Pirellulales bacterium]
MDRVAIVRRYLDAWAQRDWAAMSALFGEHGAYQDPSLRDPIVGGLAVAQNAKLTCRGLPDIRFDVGLLEPCGADRVVLHYRMCGTNTGPLGDYPATGRALDLPGVALIETDGQRIRAVQNYYDRLGFGNQLGHADYRRQRASADSESAPLSVINPYLVAPGREQEFMDQWDRRIRWLKQQPGFLDARLHRSVGDDAWYPFVSITVWESQESLSAAVAHREFRELIIAATFPGHPGVYRIEIKH